MEMIGLAAIPLLVISVPYVIWLDRVLVEPRDHAWHLGALMIGLDPSRQVALYQAAEMLTHHSLEMLKRRTGLTEVQ